MQHTYPPGACEECRLNHILDHENGFALTIFGAVKTQLVLGPEGMIVGIQNTAIWSQIREEIRVRGEAPEPQMITFWKLKGAEQEMVEWDRDERKRLRAKRDAERKRDEMKKPHRRSGRAGLRRKW